MRASSILASVLAVCAVACSTQHQEVDRLACDSCHTSDYDTAASPPVPTLCTPTDHVALGYARSCSDCHGTASWCPADAKHTKFDLTSRAHAGWDCADCHTTISYDPPKLDNPSQIACTNCHWHSAGKTDPKHIGNGDYSYAPSSCVACHGRGGRGR